jgi:hydrogenase maturation protease
VTTLFAIGNAGREDDGLGWALAEALERRGADPASIHRRLHLQVEDAEIVARASRVVFVDAYRGELPGGFAIRRCEPAAEFAFTTHGLAPESVLFLCEELYGRRPEAWCLLIAGERWGLGTGLSEAAERNLKAAEIEFARAPREGP